MKNNYNIIEEFNDNNINDLLIQIINILNHVQLSDNNE